MTLNLWSNHNFQRTSTCEGLDLITHEFSNHSRVRIRKIEVIHAELSGIWVSLKIIWNTKKWVSILKFLRVFLIRFTFIGMFTKYQLPDITSYQKLSQSQESHIFPELCSNCSDTYIFIFWKLHMELHSWLRIMECSDTNSWSRMFWHHRCEYRLVREEYNFMSSIF